MNDEPGHLIEDGMMVPESALLKRNLAARYGRVAGLKDDELADPDELERQVMMEQWAPVLSLPIRGRRTSVLAAIDESGGVDWGAFATVDFERTRLTSNIGERKVNELRERLKNLAIMFEIVSDRLPIAWSQVLRYLRSGIVELDHVVNEDMVTLARLAARMDKLRQDVAGASGAHAGSRRENASEAAK